MANPIVIVNVSQQQAPLPADLQRKGAFISTGGTNLNPGETALLTQFADLEELLAAPIDIVSGTWAAGVATINTGAAHGATPDAMFVTTISGATPDAYNGTFKCLATDNDSFRFELPGEDPGPIEDTDPMPTILHASAGEISAMARTFFTQAALQSVSIIELGNVAITEAVAELQKFIDENVDQQVFYSYLTPRRWGTMPNLIKDFVAQFESTTAKTYFFITTTLQYWERFTDNMKAVVALIEAPAYGKVVAQAPTSGTWSSNRATLVFANAHGVKAGQFFTMTGTAPAGYSGTYRAVTGTSSLNLAYEIGDPGGALTDMGSLSSSVYESAGVPPTEFSLAAVFHRTLSYDPATTNRVSPLCFAYTFGVTRFPTQGNSALLTSIKAANINYIGFGGEGGISNNMVVWGRIMDGRPWNYWYAVDWVQINAQRRLANVVINGSNTPVNPLYYNQDGINRLEQALYQMGSDGVSYGLCLGDVRQVGLPALEFANNLNKGDYAGLVIINAEPFIDYTRANPSDYRIGKYGGLAFVFTPQRGFEQIICNVNVTDIVTP